MIASIVILIFPVLAAVPAAVVLLSRWIPGAEKTGSLHRYRIFPILFFIWQWVLTWYLYETGHWGFWIRLVDPILLEGILAAVLLSEGASGDNATVRVRGFLKESIPWILGNAVVQTVFLLSPDMNAFPSMLSMIVMGWRLHVSYGKWTIRPRVRQRISILLMSAASLIPLPVFRIVFLSHLAWIWVRRFREIMTILKEEREAHFAEKQVVSRMSEALAEVIQDVTNFQHSIGNFLKGICSALEIKAGALYLWNSEQKVFRAIEVHGLFHPITWGSEGTFIREKVLHEIVKSQPIDDQNNLVWQCGHSRKPIFIPYASQDERVAALGTRASNIQSLVLAPLILEQELLGVLVLQNKLFERYITESDSYLIYTFTHYATMMVNASRMMSERLERERVSNELLLGQRIQSDLLPRRIPEVEGIELAGSMDPAKEIGGDYFDFFLRTDGRLGISIGDVSGKGVPAGMLMTILQTLLESKYPYHQNTCDLLIDVNRILSSKIKSSMFITLILFEWNPHQKKLCYTACGHEHILHFRRAENKLFTLRSGGIALGMTDDTSAIFRERELPVAPGDLVVLYTDGVIEARNPEGDMYTLARLERFVQDHHQLGAEALRIELLESLDRFRRGCEQVDDITILVMRF